LYALGAVAAGIGVYRYQPGFLHQKVLLVDDELAAIGSANLDNRSLRLNFEVMLVTVDRPFASCVEQMLSADFAQARRLTLEDARVSFIQRLWMRLTGLFAPIL
jgi:cardiolipin synthase A/B